MITWRVEDIELIPVELDFSSSGQGRRAATAIVAGGVRLINAIELVESDPTATQVEVCECCGLAGCSPGGWVAFRRVGQGVVWNPAWDQMEKGTWETSVYRPPSFLATKGAPIFLVAEWERLRALHDGLPPLVDIPSATCREIARMSQWSAHGRLLGEYPSEPRVRRDLVVAATDGDLSAEIEAVDYCLREHCETSDPVDLVGENEAVRPIEFWLDLPGTPNWSSFAHVGKRVGFLLDATAAVVRATMG